MERQAHYALVGLATFALALVLLVFAFWFIQFDFNKNFGTYEVEFNTPVDGLTKGAEVHFNGIKVGEVTKIALDKSDPNRVIARVRVTSDVPIKTDSFATLEPQGITGVNYVQITAGAPSKPLLKSTVKSGEVPVIRSQRSALSDLLEGGGTVLTRTIEALDRINRVLSDDNVKTFSASLSDVQAVTAELRERKAIIADADKALQSIEATSTKIGELSDSSKGLVDGDAKRTLKNLGDAADELKATATEVRGMVGKLEGPTTDFATTGLPQLSAAVVTLQSAAESLDRLVGEVEQNPRALVSKPPAKELEVKP